jgi:acetyl/propionyl-CoA carboxylase alpha subunit
MFRRILIANRGEIARRIARTSERLGVEFVAVYSDADANAAHLCGAVETVRIGPAPATLSYLSIQNVVEAAVKTGCDAVHPGYGFLSENAAFARAVEAAGLVFIGPRPNTIAAMGDKSAAKEIMGKAGIPVVPGTSRASDDPREIENLVEEVGFPAILKPVAGGGGKGMTIVTNLTGLRDAAQSAIRLAQSTFGDGRLLIERYIEDPRHIEVQIFGDNRGNVVHLYERECSLQRRHQKIIEEAPAPNLSAQLRAELLDAAVRGAAALSYENAGTFEFIVDPANRLYFLEVNTRLQVEHPITEVITGYDLVEWQIRIAAGEPLPVTQADIAVTGHAVECRIYAEDAADDFRPAPGRVDRSVWPSDIRVESAVVDGSVITPFYDPMIAKVIGAGSDRRQALKEISIALTKIAIFGVTTNIPLLINILQAPSVVAGLMNTGTVADFLTNWVPSKHTNTACAIAAAAAVRLQKSEAGLRDPHFDHCPSPWQITLPFDRVHLDPEAPFGRLTFWLNNSPRTVGILRDEGDRLKLKVEGEGGAGAELVTVVVDRISTTVTTGEVGGQHWSAVGSTDVVDVIFGGEWFRFAQLSRDGVSLSDQSEGNAVAPTPGTVVALLVELGDSVEVGDGLVVIEAMKLENTVKAPRAGVVAEIHCHIGEMVVARQTLMALMEPPR